MGIFIFSTAHLILTIVSCTSVLAEEASVDSNDHLDVISMFFDEFALRAATAANIAHVTNK